MTRTALAFPPDDDGVHPALHLVAGNASGATVNYMRVDPLPNQQAINDAMSQLQGAPGQTSSVVTASPNTGGMYQGWGGYSVSYENKSCEVCGTRGKRRKWRYDSERDKMVKDGFVDCDACGGQGWQQVSTTTYNTYPYTITNDIQPYTPPYPLPVMYSTTDTPVYGDGGVIGGPQFINGG